MKRKSKPGHLLDLPRDFGIWRGGSNLHKDLILQKVEMNRNYLLFSWYPRLSQSSDILSCQEAMWNFYCLMKEDMPLDKDTDKLLHFLQFPNLLFSLHLFFLHESSPVFSLWDLNRPTEGCHWLQQGPADTQSIRFNITEVKTLHCWFSMKQQVWH